MKENISIYICSSQEDEDLRLRRKLIKHISQFGSIKHRGTMFGGDHKKSTIKDYINNADIILLLVSSDFTSDSGCHEEVKWAMQRCKENEAQVIPVYLRPVQIGDKEPYAGLSALPPDEVPVTCWKNQDEAFSSVAQGISSVIDQINGPSDINPHPDIQNHSELTNPHRQTPALTGGGQPENNTLTSPTNEKSSQVPILIDQPSTGHLNDTSPLPDPPPPITGPISADSDTTSLSEQTTGSLSIGMKQELPQGQKTSGTAISHKKHPLQHKWYLALIAIVILLVLSTLLYLYTTPGKAPSPLPKHSVGEAIFDKKRADGHLKQKAADALKNGHLQAAKGFLAMASEEDSSDAEALIYQENLDIGDAPYITLVVPVKFSDDKVTTNSTRAMLQGTYVAQHEHNEEERDKNKQGKQYRPMVRLMLANLNNSPQDTIKEIKDIADKENIVGFVGHALTKNEGGDLLNTIPLVASQVSCDIEQNPTKFFSVAPSSEDVAKIAANYAKKTHAQKVAIYHASSYNTTDYYGSQCLYDKFQRQLKSEGSPALITQGYSTGKTETIQELASSTKQNKIDFIYFLGPLEDAKNLLENLREYRGKVTLLGTNMLYQYVYETANYQNDVEGIYFTSSAFHEIGKEKEKNASFFDDYNNAFNPGDHSSHIHYGHTWPDSNAILAFDAASIFLRAYGDPSEMALPDQHQHVLNNLKSITPEKPFSGVSGQIGFNINGFPVDKVVLILQLKQTTQYIDQEGRYQ